MASKNEIRTIETDVLVVGGGGAGFRAAIGARERGARALLVSKGPLARSGASPMAGADLTCHGQGMRRAGFFGEPNDTEEKFMNDIVHHGNFLNDQKLTELYVKTGPDRMLEMVEWGVRPTATDDRAVFTPGTNIMDALYRQARKLGVDFLDDTTILDLTITDGKISGALGLDIKRGEFIRFQCKAVVQATGGWHKAYTPVTGSRELTGDGIAMSYRAGASCTDMEFVTFCCNVIYWPMYASGTIMLYIIGYLYGGVLENSLGERIFDKYDPWMVGYANRTEWNKCFISHLSAREIRDGKASPHGGVYYRVGSEPFENYAARVLPGYPNWTFKGNDMSFVGKQLKSGEGVEVGPGAEYFEGGIAVNEHYESGVPGLYAAGECASSVFGANRVAAATMEMLTTGAIAGRSAGAYAGKIGQPAIDEKQLQGLMYKALQPFQRSDGVSPSELRGRIQKMAQRLLGPIRNGVELQEFLDFAKKAREEEIPALYAPSKTRAYNKAWIEALDIENLMTVLELSARAALERTESRGVHYREDFPQVDNDHWLKEIVLNKRQNGDIATSTRPVNITMMTPPTGITPYIDYLKKMMQGHSDTMGHH
jgi:succinate dehydrogenase/fumarate reductase flavoprotein subunit